MEHSPNPTSEAATSESTDSMDGWLRVATVSELKRARTIVVGHPDHGPPPESATEVGGIVVFWNGGEPRAMANRCVHKDRALARGTIFQGKVVCPGHQWAFRFDDGHCAERERTQPVFAVTVVGDEVWLDPRTPANLELLSATEPRE